MVRMLTDDGCGQGYSKASSRTQRNTILVDRHSLPNPYSQCCLKGHGNEARPVEM